MDQATAGFVATISFRTEDPDRETKLGARQEFWGRIQKELRSEDRNEPLEVLENRVVAVFPRALHRVFLQHFGTTAILAGDWVTRQPQRLNGIFFRTSIQGYGSAMLAVDVGGVKDLAEFLNGNLDAFTMLMESFVPAAFGSSVPSRHDPGDFVATIAPTAELMRVFAQSRNTQQSLTVSPSAPSETPSASHITNTNGRLAQISRAALATAFSLLTPVLLALVVLYFAAQMLLADRSELEKRQTALLSAEQNLRETQRSAAAELRQQNTELLRLLRQSESTTAPVTKSP
jgi:hypothetical protein